MPEEKFIERIQLALDKLSYISTNLDKSNALHGQRLDSIEHNLYQLSISIDEKRKEVNNLAQSVDRMINNEEDKAEKIYKLEEKVDGLEKKTWLWAGGLSVFSFLAAFGHNIIKFLSTSS